MLVLFALLVLVMAVSLITLVAPMLLPEAYTRSASIFLILLPGALATLITLPLTLPFLMFKRPRFLLMLDLISAPLLALLFFLAIREHGAIGAAWVTTLSRFAKAGLAQLLAWRLASAEQDTPLPAIENARSG